MIDGSKLNFWKMLLNVKVVSTLTLFLTIFAVYENYYDLGGIELFVYALTSIFQSLFVVFFCLILIGVVLHLVAFPFTNEYRDDLSKSIDNFKEKVDDLRNGNRND